MGGEFSLFNDLEQFLSRTELATGDLWKEVVPDELEVFPLDIVIQARNLRIDISNWSDTSVGDSHIRGRRLVGPRLFPSRKAVRNVDHIHL